MWRTMGKMENSIQQKMRDVGARIAGIRLSRNLTQGQVSSLAGTARNTVRRLEAGETVSLETYIRISEALGQEFNLDALLPDPRVRPVDRVRLQGQERQRARPDSPDAKKASEWAWGEEVDK